MSFFGESVCLWGSYDLKHGNPLQNFKHHSHWPNIYILLSFFGSISNHFKVHRVDIWLYWGLYGVIGEVLFEKVSAIEAATAWNRAIPCKKIRITHNYLLFIFYYHFLVHSLIISRSTELIFDYIEGVWESEAKFFV